MRFCIDVKKSILVLNADVVITDTIMDVVKSTDGVAWAHRNPMDRYAILIVIGKMFSSEDVKKVLLARLRCFC
jgi:hypothetical protein